jgi:excisionase family DNA binding protein
MGTVEMANKNTDRTTDRRAFRVKEFCALYSVSRSTAYKLMAEGKLRSIRVGGSRLISKEAAEALLLGAASPDAGNKIKARD